ncbi:hypothetical protein [Bacteroides nordii]|uniref:hypothetical protein n=1 Tax=Bacteroides nordii TaxID=291645 RepID=UPI00241CEB90|nr:hypothetical protein [Bacteroides nordii]
MTKKEAIKLFEEKKVRAMMKYKVSAGNKLKHRLTQIFADGKATLYLRKDILYVNLC